MTLHRWTCNALLSIAVAVPAAAQDASLVAHVSESRAVLIDDEHEELHRTLHDLEVAVQRLQHVGATDVAQQVLRVMERLEHELHEHEDDRHREHEDREHDLDDPERRQEIVHIALRACAEQEDEDLVRYLERVLHVLELQEEGADEERLAHATEGLSLEVLIEILHHSGNLWSEWGEEHEARLCHELADYIADHEEGEHDRDEHDRDGHDREVECFF